MIEVQREYIAKDKVPDTDVYQSIEKWAEKNGFLLEKFALGRWASLSRAEFSQLPKDATTLDRLLGALDSSDLKRIEMPLDIIQKLLRSKL